MATPVYATPKGYAVRIHRLGSANWQIGTNDCAYSELLSGQKNSYNHFVNSEAEAVQYLEAFGKTHGLERFDSIEAYKESKGR